MKRNTNSLVEVAGQVCVVVGALAAPVMLVAKLRQALIGGQPSVMMVAPGSTWSITKRCSDSPDASSNSLAAAAWDLTALVVAGLLAFLVARLSFLRCDLAEH